jgi:CheY-like chemotaxis protein
MGARQVLMVDDEEDIRAIGKIAIEDVGGWVPLLAASGAEALEIASRERLDLILLDVMMPGMDGPGTLARLRASPATKSTPVIFMTAKVQRAEIQHYLELGATGVIPKPFDPMTLPDEVCKILGWSD